MMQKKNTTIRKEEIVQAALKVIGNRGVKALTIAAIAEMAGMCEANIYRHFNGKDDIHFALADFIGTTVMAKASIIAEENRNPSAKLETIFFSHFALIAKHPGLPRFIFSEDIRLGNKKLAEKISNRLLIYVETMTGIIAAGINDGDFRKDISPRETALTLLGIIQSTALRWTNDQSSFDIMKEAKKLWLNFIKLVT
jgi:AcrR family transcriptional regulator